ncbi:b(0,+)-type amino acid transporter 1-like [Amphibalanus amphitrite]|uniref:b(0,+)-type amino acid transporter 1-like n=1 Tax=Amphibalanus amphitrite TaxID=1232801 RepID=UPI001C9075C8|nr:b(0,+)-type amino acid transporter 1-like [Amphibalanus amphitrite]
MDNPAFVDSETPNGAPLFSPAQMTSLTNENCNGHSIPSRTESSAPLCTSGSATANGSTTTADEPPGPVCLRRTLGLVSVSAIMTSTMIGSGIFMSAGTVLALSGGALLPALLIWASCGLLCLLAGVAYVELSCVVPSAGGEFAAMLHAFGPLHEFLGPLPAFLYAWMTCLVSRPANTAIQSLAVAEYCVQPWFGAECRPPVLAIALVALCANTLSAFINSYSVRLTATINNLFAAAKLVVMIGIVAGGVYFIVRGGTRHLTAGMPSERVSIVDLTAAFYTCLWAYEGWNNLNFLTEEMSNPVRDMPRALFIGVPLVTFSYLLVNTAYLTVLSPDEVIATPAAAVAFAEHALGSAAGLLIPLCVALSVYGTLNGTIMASSRLSFTAARAGHLARPLALLQTTSRTPAPAIIFNTLVSSAMLAYGDFEKLITFASLTVWIFYGLAMVALLVMRRTRPDAPRPFRAPTAVPWLVLVMAVLLMAVPLVNGPRLDHLAVLAFLVTGVLVYWRCVYRHRPSAGSQRVTLLLQKLLLLAGQH